MNYIFTSADLLSISRSGNVSKIIVDSKFKHDNPSPELEVVKINDYKIEEDFPDMQF